MMEANADKLIAAKLILTHKWPHSLEGLFVKWGTTEPEWCFQNLCCSDCSLAHLFGQSHSQSENLTVSLPTYEMFVFIAVNSWKVRTKGIYVSRFMEWSKKKEEGRLMPLTCISFIHFFLSYLERNIKCIEFLSNSLYTGKISGVKYTATCALEIFNF